MQSSVGPSWNARQLQVRRRHPPVTLGAVLVLLLSTRRACTFLSLGKGHKPLPFSVSWCLCLGIKGHKRWLRPERGGLPNSNKPSSSGSPVQKTLAPVLLPPDLWDWTSVMLEVQEPLATRRTKHRPRKTERKDSRSCVPGAAAGQPGSRASGPGPCAGATGQSCS